MILSGEGSKDSTENAEIWSSAIVAITIHDSRSRRMYWARKRREGVLKDVVGSRSRTTGMSYGEKMDVGALLGRRCKADVRPVPERIRP